jgi:hypothetical protein
MLTNAATRSGMMPAYSPATLAPMLCPTIGDVVRKPVALRPAPGFAEASPVGCDDEPVSLQLIHQELKRGPGIVPAVQQDQQRLVRVPPLADTVFDPPHVLTRGTWFDAGAVHLVNVFQRELTFGLCDSCRV